MSRIYLDQYLRTGDRVIANRTREARAHGVGDVPDGTIGTVVGFTTFVDYVGRVHTGGRRPGRYLRNGAAIVRWDSGAESTPGAGAISWLDQTDALEHSRRTDIVWSNAYERHVFLGDLPASTLCYEHDIALIKDPEMQRHLGCKFLIVDRIEWRVDDPENSEVSSAMYTCLVAAPDEAPIPGITRGSTVYMNENEIELHTRGNVYHWFNREPLVFRSGLLSEEISLHNALGQRQQIRNLRDGCYLWPLKAAVEAAQRGWIDGATTFSLGTSDPSVNAYRYFDRSLGERIRADFLEQHVTKPTVLAAPSM
jgi:hypothetical protein